MMHISAHPVLPKSQSDATLALLDGGIYIHTLSRQMGTIVLMLERHNSELTAAMAENRFT